MIRHFLFCLLFCAGNALAQNPISPMGVYIADPTSRVNPDGRLYIYGSLDTSPKYYCSKDYHVLSSDDLCHWTLHRNSFSWNETLYAPDMMYHNGQYHLYFDTPNGNEYVAVADAPTGPWRNAVQIEGPRQIDPNIFIDDDGQAYYFWGQFAAKGARMNPDLKTLDLSSMRDSIVTEAEHGFHEGSYVIRRGKYYYFIYADISRNGRPTCLGYSMATSPLGPYEYKGIIIDNAGCDPETWNNHGSVVQFGKQWYVLYHRSTHGCNTMRKACIEPIRFNENGTIDEVEMTSQGAAGPLDAFQTIDAARACRMQGHLRIRLMADSKEREELGAIRAGDAAVWKYIDFEWGARSVTLRAQAPQGATVTLHADTPDGPQLGTVDISPQEGWQECQTHIKKIKGEHALWLIFQSASDNLPDADIMNLDWFRFGK